jgi:hypothetical protein
MACLNEVVARPTHSLTHSLSPLPPIMQQALFIETLYVVSYIQPEVTYLNVMTF